MGVTAVDAGAFILPARNTPVKPVLQQIAAIARFILRLVAVLLCLHE
jgi:hypothetical protein